jgi:hypothetical protein
MAAAAASSAARSTEASLTRSTGSLVGGECGIIRVSLSSQPRHCIWRWWRHARFASPSGLDAVLTVAVSGGWLYSYVSPQLAGSVRFVRSSASLVF